MNLSLPRAAIPAKPGQGCKGCGGQVFDPEKIVSSAGLFHATCYKCQGCGAALDASTGHCQRGKPLCKGCWVKARQSGEDSGVWARAHVETKSIVATGGEEGCPRCGGRVYQAERRVAAGAAYHVACFSCQECKKLLDQTTACEAEGELLCKGCFTRLHHVSQLKVAEADKALDTSLILPREEEEGCPSCKGAVFAQERLQVGGKAYHRACLSCTACSRKLALSAVIIGEDGEAYCQACHREKFSHSGFSIPDPALIQAAPGVGDGCRACGGKVYEPEKVASKTGIFHKQCFACKKCKKKLDSTLVYAFEAPDSQIYCKKCFTENFGEGKKPLLWADTTTILPVDGKGCPRCGGAVFKQEEVMEKGRNFHKRCFSCKKCHRPQADKLQVFVGQDEEIYCRNCYPDLEHTPASGQATTTIQDENGCPRCGGKVFEAERVGVRGGRYFHKSCLTCSFCHTPLSLSSMFCTEKGEVACKGCYQQNFFTGGRNEYLDYSKVGESRGLGPVCPGCKGDVYEAEKVVTKEHTYHRKCLLCTSCRRALDASSYFEGSDKLVYCKGCYTSQFGDLAPAAQEEMIRFPATSPGDTKCLGCSSKVFEAEKMISSFGVFHRQCYKCVDCSTLLHTAPAYKYHGDRLFCKSCFTHARDRAKAAGEDEDGSLVCARAMVETESIKAADGDPDKCPRCSGKVFPAERMAMRSGNYHKSCFSCGKCKRLLDFTLACDGPTGDVFCKNCYGQMFGPSSLARDLSSAADTTSIKPSESGPGCPRCLGAVFKAEEVTSKGRSFHRSCATCAKCSRQLDTRSLCAGEGDDKEIYCQGCFRQKYRASRPTTPAPSNGLPALEGEVACARCKGKVFEPERLHYKSATFHKTCFTCRECSKCLDSPLAAIASGPDGENY